MNKTKINAEQLQQLKELLLANEDKNYSGNYLEDLLNLNKIGIRDGIRKLRLEGLPIVAKGPLGYSYTNNKEEIMKTALSLLSRGKKIVDVGNEMIRACHKDTPHYNLK